MNGNNYKKYLLESQITLRRALGIFGIALPFILMFWGLALLKGLQPSISEYYHLRTVPVFVGVLFLIAGVLGTYKGYERIDNVSGYVACVFALGVAIFPNHGPEGEQGWESAVHFISAAGLFLTLSFFSLILFTKTKKSESQRWWHRIFFAFRFGHPKPGDSRTPQKRWRNRIYVLCGVGMLTCMILTALYFWLWQETVISHVRPVFWLEASMVWLFGISWLVKSEVPFLFRDE